MSHFKYSSIVFEYKIIFIHSETSLLVIVGLDPT